RMGRRRSHQQPPRCRGAYPGRVHHAWTLRWAGCMMVEPTLQDVLDARARVYAAIQRTALLRHPLLDEWLGCTAWVKHENHNPTGSLKIRGGPKLISQLSPDGRRRG